MNKKLYIISMVMLMAGAFAPVQAAYFRQAASCFGDAFKRSVVAAKEVSSRFGGSSAQATSSTQSAAHADIKSRVPAAPKSFINTKYSALPVVTAASSKAKGNQDFSLGFFPLLGFVTLGALDDFDYWLYKPSDAVFDWISEGERIIEKIQGSSDSKEEHNALIKKYFDQGLEHGGIALLWEKGQANSRYFPDKNPKEILKKLWDMVLPEDRLLVLSKVFNGPLVSTVESCSLFLDLVDSEDQKILCICQLLKEFFKFPQDVSTIESIISNMCDFFRDMRWSLFMSINHDWRTLIEDKNKIKDQLVELLFDLLVQSKTISFEEKLKIGKSFYCSCENDQINYTEKMLAVMLIDDLDLDQADDIVRYLGFYLPKKESERMLLSVWKHWKENSLKESMASKLVTWRLLENNILENLSYKDRLDYLADCVDVKDSNVLSQLDFEKIFKDFSKEEAMYYAHLVFEICGNNLTVQKKFYLMNFYYSQEEMLQFLSDTYVEFVPLLSKKMSSGIKGPLFSDFFIKNFSKILCVIEEKESENLKALLWDITEYVEQEYKDDRIVFFHGQHSQWAFLGEWFTELSHCVQEREALFGDNFVPFRFSNDSFLTDEEVSMLCTNGLTKETFEYYRFSILFANLHLFANSSGSNSWHYVTTNSDQTVGQKRYDFKNALQEMFKNLGLFEEYQMLLSTMSSGDKTVFDELYDLYEDAIKDQGDFGRLLMISMSRDTARELAYSTTSGGPLKPIMINGKETTDVVEIADNHNQAPFYHEFAIILSKKILDPKAAQEAGVKIKGIDPTIYQRTEKYMKYVKRRKEVIAWVREHYQKRMAAAQ